MKTTRLTDSNAKKNDRCLVCLERLNKRQKNIFDCLNNQCIFYYFTNFVRIRSNFCLPKYVREFYFKRGRVPLQVKKLYTLGLMAVTDPIAYSDLYELQEGYY